ncbi:LolA family protein [Arsenicibacter rosenii]|uniref:Cell envelope biogenesis protein LolA n=1 Tax=Arsenicibacter rosenii TaxID=1750698 RepID=A0A1S2VN59_9BACT|nr:outer membrane lipoprotein carrier protein LolA [Arsenicibacter rosenii]OIN60184.1 cell envelope biogenesis protein LolA [Arsenicibacter rosenii]
MRRLMLLFLLVAGFIGPAAAQKDKRAKEILDAMSKKYKTLKTYQAAFTFTTEGAGAKESYKGDLTVKDTKFRLKLGGQEVFNDGKTMYTYVKESNEVNVQDYDGSDNSDLNPARIYSIYNKGFNYRFLSEKKEGSRTLEQIELTPEKKTAQISKIQINVDKADKSVRSWTTTDKTGKKTSYTINKFVPNTGVADSYFVFDKAKYPGVEVVDLR